MKKSKNEHNLIVNDISDFEDITEAISNNFEGENF